MWVAATLSASTFKPAVDKWVATDGADVVIWASDDELTKLSYRDGAWLVTRHVAASSDAAVGQRFGVFGWCGRLFRQDGEQIAVFDGESSRSEWARCYDDCLRAGAGAGEYAAVG